MTQCSSDPINELRKSLTNAEDIQILDNVLKEYANEPTDKKVVIALNRIEENILSNLNSIVKTIPVRIKNPKKAKAVQDFFTKEYIKNPIPLEWKQPITNKVEDSVQKEPETTEEKSNVQLRSEFAQGLINDLNILREIVTDKERDVYTKTLDVLTAVRDSTGDLAKALYKDYSNAKQWVKNFKRNNLNKVLAKYGFNANDLTHNLVMQDLLALNNMKLGKKQEEARLARAEIIDNLSKVKDITKLGETIQEYFIKYGYPSVRDYMLSQTVQNPESVNKTLPYKKGNANLEQLNQNYEKLKDINSLFLTGSTKKNTWLSSRPNLLTKLANPTFTKALAEELGISPESVNSFKLLGKNIQVFSNYLQDNIAPIYQESLVKEDYLNNPLNLLLDANNRLPQPLVDAMSLAGMNFVAGDLYRTTVNSDAEINAILGRDYKEKVSDEESKIFRFIGQGSSSIESRLGREVLNSINLKIAKDAPENFKEKLESAIGATVLMSLADFGIVNINAVNKQELAKLGIERADTKSAEAELHFISMAIESVDANGNKIPPKSTRAIKNIVEGLQPYISSLIGLESESKGYSYEPNTYVNAQVGNTPLTAPDEFVENVRLAQQHGFKAKTRMFNYLDALGDDLFVLAAGGLTQEEIDNEVNLDRKESKEANNELLKRELKAIRDFQKKNSSNLEKLIYFTYNIWVNYRMGINSNDINFQTSKIHRHMFSGSTWDTTINKNNPEEMARFKDAVAQFLGYKTDKQTIDRTINDFDNGVMKDTVIMDAVKVAQAIQAGENISAKQKQQLLDGIKKGKEKIGALDAIDALATYMSSTGDTFVTNIPKEVDGVTNGLSNILMQLAPSNEHYRKLMNAVGFYFKGDSVEDFLSWRSQPGNKDLYEALTKEISRIASDIDSELITGKTAAGEPSKKNLAALFSPRASAENKDKLNKIYNNQIAMRKVYAIKIILNILSDKTKTDPVTGQQLPLFEDVSRAFAKDPLMVFGYGAGLPAILRAKSSAIFDDMQDTMMSYIKDFNQMVTNNASEVDRAIQRNKIVNLLNAYIDLGSGQPNVKLYKADTFPINEVITNYTGLLSEATQDKKGYPQSWNKTNITAIWNKTNITAIMQNYFAPILEEAFESQYADLNERKTTLLQGMQLSNFIFKAYEEIKLDEARKAGNGILTKEAEDKVHQQMLKDGHMVTMNNHMSKDKHNNGILIANIVDVPINEDANGKLSVKRKKDKLLTINNITVDESGNIKTKKVSRKSYGSSLTKKEYSTNIGVKSGPLTNIPQDAFVLNPTVARFEAIDIFDAKITGLNNVDESTKFMNDINRANHNNWDMALEHSKTLDRFMKLAKTNKVIMDRASAMWIDSFEQRGLEAPSINDFMSAYEKTISNIKADKAKNLADQTVSDQFPYGQKNASTEVKELSNEELVTQLNELSNPDNAQGSEATRFDPNNYINAKQSTVNADTVKSTFNNLENVGNVRENSTHKEYLSNLINDFIQPALQTSDAFTLFERDTNFNRNVGARLDNNIYLDSARGLIDANTEMSAQEVFAHEMTHGVWAAAIDNNSSLRNRLIDLLELAREGTTIEDFLKKDSNGRVIIPAGSDMKTELNKAKARYDYVFNSTKDNAYLHEFGTIALTNEAFMKHLSSLDANPPKNPIKGTIVQKVLALFSNAVAWLQGWIYGTKDKNIAEAIRMLAISSTQTNLKGEAMVQQYLLQLGKINSFVASKLNNNVYKPYMKGMEKFFMQDDKIKQNKWVSIASLPVALPYFITSDSFHKALNKHMYKAGWNKDNALYKWLFEVAPTKAKNIPFDRIARAVKEHVESARQHIKNSVTNQLVDSFDPDKPLTEDQWKAMNTVLKTDLISLVDPNNKEELDGLIKYLESNKEIDREISKLVREIKRINPTYALLFEQQAEGLGYLMATGKSILDHQLLNAHLIASKNKNKAEHKNLINLIDKVATLWALRASPESHRNDITDIIKHENTRNVEQNGIQMFMNIHKLFKKDALEKNFNNNPAAMMKGYTKEQFDPMRSMKVAPASQERELAKQGYIKKHKVVRDNYLDPLARRPDSELYIYVSKDGLLNQYLNGIFNLAGMRAKGTNSLEMLIQLEDEAIYSNHQAMQAEIHKKSVSAFNKQHLKRMINYNRVHMVPSLNPNGYIHTYRYMMSEENKIDLLGKRDLGHEVLGSMYGAITEKYKGEILNTITLKALKEDYDKYYTSEPHEYTFIKKGMEEYDLLPDNIKAKVNDIWRIKDGFYVRTEIKDMVFGYRKLSLTSNINEWSKAKLGRELSPVFARAMRIAGMLWEHLVSRAKRVIVILTPAVVIGNTISNVVLLMMRGVPPNQIIRDMFKAANGIIKYDSLLDKIDRLEREIKSNPNSANSRAKKIKLEQMKINLQRNPVAGLIDQGVFQTIAEDINSQDRQVEDLISNISENTGLIAKKAGEKIPEFLKQGYKQITVTPDTGTGRVLARVTQYSDFIARYALYNHLINNKKLDQESAIQDILETFVNYDEHTGKYLQYLNDMGLLMFTKFLFRIQRVIAKAFINDPANVIASEMLQRAIADVPDIVDSNIISSLFLKPIGARTADVTDAFGPHIFNWVPGM